MSENAETPPHDEVDPDLYMDDFAEMLRELMRAIAATDASSALANASRRMRCLYSAADRLPAELNWYKIFEGAIGRLNVDAPCSDPDHEHVGLAKRSIKYFAELTTSDGFSAARVSRAQQEINEEIRHLEQRRLGS